jgi:hypothetical protein
VGPGRYLDVHNLMGEVYLRENLKGKGPQNDRRKCHKQNLSYRPLHGHLSFDAWVSMLCHLRLFPPLFRELLRALSVSVTNRRYSAAPYYVLTLTMSCSSLFTSRPGVFADTIRLPSTGEAWAEQLAEPRLSDDENMSVQTAATSANNGKIP